MKISKALTWDDLANEYGRLTGGKARIKPMDSIFKWAENRKEDFYVDPKEGTIHKILEGL